MGEEAAVIQANVGKYELVARLSRGGMAELFLAFASGPGAFRKFLVLKRVLPLANQDDGLVRMFLDEARITAALWHSNIGQVYDLTEINQALYLAMEFIPGANLREILFAALERFELVPVGFTCRAIREACMALHHAHQFVGADGKPFPIVHRDVSPSNIMVSYEGEVKVIDFGIAKLEIRLEKTPTGKFKGTLGYYSPEQIDGGEVDPRSDIFALGAILHELFTGRKLFSAVKPAEHIQQVLSMQIPPPEKLNPLVPPALSEVVLKALSRKREDRFQSCREMADALNSAAGPLLFDEAKASAYMGQLFPERVMETRALFAANLSEVSKLRDAAEKLSQRLSVVPQPRRTPVSETRTFNSSGSMRESSDTGPVQQTAAVSRILVVDDSPTIITVLKSCLTAAGYEVEGWVEPKKALESLDERTPDLIILDVNMPEMDGFEFCRLVRERRMDRYVPILFLSASVSLDERVRSLNMGGDDFIRKPVEPEELTVRVRVHLQRVATLSALGSRSGNRAVPTS